MTRGSQTQLATIAASLTLLMPSLSNGVLLALSPEKAIKQYSHEIWTSENGLPQNSILAIAQTRDGYLWFGTEEGLVRFDGVSFTIFDKSNTKEIKHNNISALFEDRVGNLWIGTGGGLNRFKDEQFTSYTTENGMSKGAVFAICEDQEGSLWIGTANGVNRFRDDHFTIFTTREGLASDYVLSIYEDKEASLWIGTNSGLNKFRDGEFTSFTTKEGLANNSVFSIHGDKDANLWIGTANGLSRFKDGKFTTLNTKDGLIQNFVTSIFEDKEGRVWVGTNNGLNRFKDNVFTSFGVKDGLSQRPIRAIYEDKEGSLWIGIKGGGLNRFKEDKFTSYTTKDGLSNDAVRAIYEDEKGVIWMGTMGGLNRFHNGKFTAFTSKDGLSGGAVLTIYEDKLGSLWIGTENGGLHRFKDEKFTTFTSKEGLSNETVLSVSEDKEGNLWIGTAAGLNRFKDGKFTAFTTKNGLSNDVVLSIFGDKEGSLWIGTDGGGLNRFKDGKFNAFTARDGLFDDKAFQILEDDQGNLWMSCNKGIYRISKRALEAFADGRIGTLHSVTYGTTDGMRINECNAGSPAGFKARDGKLWFATQKGAAVIDPNNLKLNRVPPPVAIEKITLDTKYFNPRKKLEASPGIREVEFHFTALSFLVPEKVRFKYKLEGFDRDWVDAGTQRIAHYTNLPPGNYRFRVIACNNDGLWNETGATFEFYLQPHFYQTRWFYALCTLAVALACFSLYKLRVSQLRRRTEELELIVDQRTGDLRSSQERVLKLEKLATEQQMAGGFAHEMRNALAGSKLLLDQALALDGPEPRVSLNLANCRGLKEMYLVVKDKLPEADTKVVLGYMQSIFANEERLNEVMQLVCKATSRGLNITQQIMDYSKMGQQQPGQQSVDLQNLIVTIVNESREEFTSQGVAVEYKSGPQVLTLIGDETHFYSIIKNIVLNSRDALIDPSLKDRKDRRIEITTVLESDMCSIVVADNGIGIPHENLQKVFEPFFSTKPATGTGLGLGMVKKMVSVYNGKIEVSSEVGKGTSVTVSLPISRPRESV